MIVADQTGSFEIAYFLEVILFHVLSCYLPPSVQVCRNYLLWMTELSTSQIFDVHCTAMQLILLTAEYEDYSSSSLERVKQRIKRELESLQNQNSIITKRDLHIGLSLIRTGLSCIRTGSLVEANRNFVEALDHAAASFNESATFEDLSLSMRLQVFCTIMIHHGCYLASEGDVCNKSQLIEDCQGYFIRFTMHPLVTNALKDEFEGRSVFDVLAGRIKLSDNTRAFRQHILHDINCCNIFFENKFDFRFPVYKNATETVNLSQAKDLVISRSTTQICCFAIHKQRLFAGCGDNSITVYDLTTFAKVDILRGHSFFVEVLLVHEDVLYSCSYDQSLILWDLNSSSGDSAGGIKMIKMMTNCGRMVSSLAVHNSSSITAGSSKCRRTLFTGSVGDDSFLRVWNLNTLKERQQPVYCGAFHWVFSLLCHQDRLYVSSTWYRGTDEALHFHCITVWDLPTHSSGPFSMTLVGILKGHFHNIKSLSIYGSHTLCSGSCDKTVIVWDLTTLELQQILKGHSGDVSSLTHFNHRLYVNDGGKGVRSWHLLSLDGSEHSSVASGGAAFHDQIRHLVAERGRLFILSGGSVFVRLL